MSRNASEAARILEVRGAGRRLPDESAGADEVGVSWLFRHLHLEVRCGELVSLQGPTGSGKTLLLRALAGLDPLNEGQILLEGRDFSEWPAPEYRRRVVYLHQDPALFPGTVEENLRAPFSFAAHEDRLRYRRGEAIELLTGLGRGAGFLDADAEDLSGGERQITALVRALLVEPTLLLMDEPTAALDPDSTGALESQLRRWIDRSPRSGVLWVTHAADQADRLGDRHLVLREGALRRREEP